MVEDVIIPLVVYLLLSQALIRHFWEFYPNLFQFWIYSDLAAAVNIFGGVRVVRYTQRMLAIV